ncbi:MAG: hypothetical protein FWD76_00330 [Firmicutes bacterium]|nr:hypothetical protein [Bacillota bacterium]
MSKWNNNYFDGLASIVGTAVLGLMGLLLLWSIIVVIAKRKKALAIFALVLSVLVTIFFGASTFIDKARELVSSKLPSDWTKLVGGRLYELFAVIGLWAFALLFVCVIKARKGDAQDARATVVDENGMPIFDQGGFGDAGMGYLPEGQGAYLGEGQGDFYGEQQGYYDEFGNWVDQSAGGGGNYVGEYGNGESGWANSGAFDPLSEPEGLSDGMGLELSRAQEELRRVEQIQAKLDKQKREEQAVADIKAKQDAINAQIEQARIEAEIAQAEAELVKAEAERVKQEALIKDQEKLTAEIARLAEENAKLQEDAAKAAAKPARATTTSTRPSLLERAGATKTATATKPSAGGGLKERMEQMKAEREAKAASKPATTTRATVTKTATAGDAKPSLKEKMEQMKAEREAKAAGKPATTTTTPRTTTPRTTTATKASTATGEAKPSLKEKMEQLKKEREAKGTTASAVTKPASLAAKATTASTATKAKTVGASTDETKKKPRFERDENGKMRIVKD